MDYDARVAGELDPTTTILKWRVLAVGGVLVAAALIGTAGFRIVEGWPLFDAFYMALMTLTTVGYGEIHPLSFRGRLFASFLMLVGVATVFISFAILGDTLLRLELADYFGRRRRTRMLEGLAGHYIVCGAGRVGRSVVLELLHAGARVVLIDNDAERVKWPRHSASRHSPPTPPKMKRSGKPASTPLPASCRRLPATLKTST